MTNPRKHRHWKKRNARGRAVGKRAAEIAKRAEQRRASQR